MAEGLKRLLKTEAELDALLESTKKRAAELVEAARAEAERRVRSHEQELQKKQSALQVRLDAECESSIQEVTSEAAREVERLDGLSKHTIDELARHVVEKLVRAPRGGGS
jgi:vacuolar-type H+-ATPase subunit H